MIIGRRERKDAKTRRRKEDDCFAAFDILRLQLTEFGAVGDAMMLKSSGNRGREEDVWLPVRLRLQEGDNGQFACIVGIFANHWLEAIVRGFRPAEIELDQGG